MATYQWFNRDGLQESEDVPLAEDVLNVNRVITKLEEDRKKICEDLPSAIR